MCAFRVDSGVQEPSSKLYSEFSIYFFDEIYSLLYELPVRGINRFGSAPPIVVSGVQTATTLQIKPDDGHYAKQYRTTLQ